MAITIEYDLNICLTVKEWNSSWLKLLTCLYGIAGPLAFQVIIVDQSPATRPAQITDKFPELVLYDNNGPGNTPTALNSALRLAGGRHLALWTPEIHPDPLCLEKLVRFLDQNPDAGICGPKIVAHNGAPLPSGGRFPALFPMLFTCRMIRSANKSRPAQNTEVAWLAGEAMIIRREVLSDSGLLDEGFSADLFDLDLCRRAVKNGWHLWQIREATASSHLPVKEKLSKKLHGGDVLRLFLKKIFPIKSQY